jgi:apolipoprotein N-acyltransferase
MTVISGLPAHVLLVHFVVVLAPLTALLEILCAVWPAARRRLVWLVLALAVVTAVVTPLTIDAGQWYYDQKQRPSTLLQTHADRGEWMIYFSVALLVVAVALAVLQWLEGRSDKRRLVATVVVAIIAVAVGTSSIITVYRIGDSGARAVWQTS